MKTPEGWARANLLLRTLQAPPPKGSLQEWALILLLDRLEDIDHAKYLALVQVIIDREAGVKAFESYMEIAFPSLALRKKEQRDEMRKVLEEWVDRGPMKVTPLMPLTGRSKLKTRAVKVIEDEKQNAFYRELGTPWRSQNQNPPSMRARIAAARQ